mmetsp:Transcript_7747/g.26494  ORF Transcript_7747/g.26494 Transcript_7747/m.26494 type:complete len:225 (-) Transcript_7747:394-1068(-)
MREMSMKPSGLVAKNERSRSSVRVLDVEWSSSRFRARKYSRSSNRLMKSLCIGGNAALRLSSASVSGTRSRCTRTKIRFFLIIAVVVVCLRDESLTRTQFVVAFGSRLYSAVCFASIVSMPRLNQERGDRSREPSSPPPSSSPSRESPEPSSSSTDAALVTLLPLRPDAKDAPEPKPETPRPRPPRSARIPDASSSGSEPSSSPRVRLSTKNSSPLEPSPSDST